MIYNNPARCEARSFFTRITFVSIYILFHVMFIHLVSYKLPAVKFATFLKDS